MSGRLATFKLSLKTFYGRAFTFRARGRFHPAGHLTQKVWESDWDTKIKRSFYVFYVVWVWDQSRPTPDHSVVKLNRCVPTPSHVSPTPPLTHYCIPALALKHKFHSMLSSSPQLLIKSHSVGKNCLSGRRWFCYFVRERCVLNIKSRFSVSLSLNLVILSPQLFSIPAEVAIRVATKVAGWVKLFLDARDSSQKS